MKKIIFALAIFSLLGLGILGAHFASAHGWLGGVNALSPDETATRQNAIFQRQALLLGISIDEVKNFWAQGKNIKEIAAEKGITGAQLLERINEAKKEKMRAHLNILIEKGMVTQAQADQRLKFMEEKIANGKMNGGFHKDFHCMEKF